MQKSKVYKWIKIGGLLSFLPFVMAAGPLGGYLIGELLQNRLHMPPITMAICIILGFAGSAFETVKIIRAALRAEEKE
jgi:F0F1-type ATP synthase assembly protein I